MREELERIIWHAMTSMAGSRQTLAEAKAAPPSVDRNYALLFLSNAVDAVVASSSPPQRIERQSDDQARMTAKTESGDPR